MGCNGSKQADSVTDSQKPEEPKGKPGRICCCYRHIWAPVSCFDHYQAEINKDYPSKIVGEQIFIAKIKPDADLMISAFYVKSRKSS
jgi:hypothetical protein